MEKPVDLKILFSSKIQSERLSAVSLVKKQSHPEAKVLLRDGLGHWDKKFRVHCAEALIYLFGEEYAKEVIDLAKENKLPKEFMIKVLSRIDKQYVTEWLVPFLEKSYVSESLRTAAERSIFKQENSYAVLYKWIRYHTDTNRLRDKLNKLTQEDFISVLSKLTDVLAHCKIEAFLKDPDVRKYLKDRKLELIYEQYGEYFEDIYGSIVSPSQSGEIAENDITDVDASQHALNISKKSKLDLDPLARKIEVPKELLGWMIRKWNDMDSFYNTFKIKKKSGKEREICSPIAPLKYIQKNIYESVLKKINFNEATHGFIPNKSIITNATSHIGKDMIINIDLKDFFPSITAARVYGIFKSIGFHEKSARFLTRLTTCNGRLPQGAPTSPALANLACRRLDSRLSGLATRVEASYSRYADDITFSGNDGIISVLPLVKQIIIQEGLTISAEKLRIVRKGNRQEVTGLVVNDKLSIPRERRKILRAITHYLKQGKDIHWDGKKINKDVLMGHLAFLNSVHPELAVKYSNTINKDSK